MRGGGRERENDEPVAISSFRSLSRPRVGYRRTMVDGDITRSASHSATAMRELQQSPGETRASVVFIAFVWRSCGTLVSRQKNAKPFLLNWAV